MSRSLATLVGLLGGMVASGLLVVVALSGRPPQKTNLERFAVAGIIEADPARASRIVVHLGKRTLRLVREGPGAWALEGKGPIPPAEAEHVRLGLRFLHVTEPTRVLAPGEYEPSERAAFGLAEPRLRVILYAGREKIGEAVFGGLNPAGTDQYASVVGRPEIYLLPLHVGREWASLEHLFTASAGGAPAGEKTP